MCVTPAYRRSARPRGQHMTSTLENPASEAKCMTCSSVYSGKIAETNPSFIAVGLLSSRGVFSVEGRSSSRGRIDPAFLPMAPRDGLAEPDLAVAVGEGRISREPF